MHAFFRSSLSILTILITLLPAFSHAAYSVSPLVIDEELSKRDIVTHTITLTNTGSNRVRIYPTVNEISVDDGGRMQSFVEPSMVDDRTTSITAWLEISRARIELDPGQTKEIPLTIRVHPDVAPGEYHAFVGFAQGSNRPDAEASVAQGGAPGTVVRIGVDKVQDQFLRLVRFSVERFVKDAGEGSLTYTLHNPGEHPVVPRGEVIFYDNNGYEVTAVPVNPEAIAIDEKGEASFTGEIPRELPLGKYKALLSVEYGDTQTASLHDTSFFYVLPLKWLIIIFAVVLSFAVLLALYVHKKYDVGEEDTGAEDVALYIRQGKSEGKDHDIDLTKNSKN